MSNTSVNCSTRLCTPNSLESDSTVKLFTLVKVKLTQSKTNLCLYGAASCEHITAKKRGHFPINEPRLESSWRQVGAMAAIKVLAYCSSLMLLLYFLSHGPRFPLWCTMVKQGNWLTKQQEPSCFISVLQSSNKM